jgi:hypothetical protein
MMTNDKVDSTENISSTTSATSGVNEDCGMIIGRFTAVCKDSDGNTLWTEEFNNTVTVIGKQLLLDTTLAGSAYTTVGPYMGLISSVSYAGAPLYSDTMASHTNWKEADSTNAPAYTLGLTSGGGATRGTTAWSASTTSTSTATKALSASQNYYFTGAGTVEGIFIVTGTGAVSTWENTSGTLFSAGAFGTAQPVVATNTLSVSYSTSIA